MKNRKYVTPFSLLHAASLLSHKSRIKKFSEAIKKAVNAGDFVVDLGTGSGILAILAAKQGAWVTAIDATQESLNYARQAAMMNDVEDKIEFICTPFSEFKLKETVDVVICEMLSSIMLIEQQIAASKYALEHLLNPTGVLIPNEVHLFVCPVENEMLWNRFTIEGLRFPRVPQSVSKGQSIDLADLHELQRYDFSSTHIITTTIDRVLEFEITQNGIIHGLVGMFEATLFDNITLNMEDGWRELFMPLPKEIEVEEGDKVRIRITFTPGEYDSLRLEIL